MKSPPLETPVSIFVAFPLQIFLLLCLFAGLIYSATELVFFSLVILVMGAGAYSWSRLGNHRLATAITLDRHRLFPGDRLTIRIQAFNAKVLPVLLKIDLHLPGSITGAAGGKWLKERIGLLWYQQASVSTSVTVDRRGVFDIGSPRLRSGDLFGFYSSRKRGGRPLEVIVYPRVFALSSFPIPKRELHGAAGAKSPVADPLLIYGTQAYQPGSPARWIHWKASARHGRLQEKRCEPTKREKVLLLLDVDGFQNDGSGMRFERCLEMVASLVLHINRRGVAAGFATNGTISGGGSRVVAISRSPRQTAAILEVLARVGPESVGPLPAILSRACRIPWGAGIIYFARERSIRTRWVESHMHRWNAPVQWVLACGRASAQRHDGHAFRRSLYLEELLPSGRVW